MKLLGYQQFLLERKEQEWKDLTIEKLQVSILEEISNQLVESRDFINFVISENLASELFTDSFSLNENLIDKWKEKFNTAKEKIKEKGKEALSAAEEKIMSIGANIGSVIKMISSQVTEALKKVWEQIKSSANGASKKASAAIQDKVEGMNGDKQNLLGKEIKDFKSMAGAGAKWVFGGFAKQMETAAVKAAKEEDKNESVEYFLENFGGELEKSFYLATLESIKDGSLDLDFVFEGGDHGHDDGPKIPFLSAIASKLSKYPPFSWLHDVQHKAQELAKSGLDKLSYYLTEIAGAPGPFEFVVLSFLIGAAVEYFVKDLSKGAILALIPGIGTLVYMLKYTALGLTVIGVAEAAMKKTETPSEKE
jgi:hypothetical protein